MRHSGALPFVPARPGPWRHGLTGPAGAPEPSRYFLLTIDLEDWYQVENFKSLIPMSSWPSFESRVERNTHLILDLLDSAGPGGNAEPLKVTFFALGAVAERNPGLVRQIRDRGHEVASHGYSHDLCGRYSAEELRKDLANSKKLLEDILGTAVLGYRAPSFSISEEALAIVEGCGYLYDSSFNSFSGNGRYGRIRVFPDGPSIVCGTLRGVYELPVSNLEVGGRCFPAGGGAYFRLMPVRVFEKIVRAVLRRRNAYLFYMHPWEVDPGQPRVRQASAFSRFRHYTNLSRTLPRLRFLLDRFKHLSFVSCGEYLRRITAGRREA